MIKKERIKQFYKFMAEAGCTRKWAKNFMEDNHMYLEDRRVPDFLNNHGSRSWVMAAFVWGSTDEGSDYWADIDYEWLEVLNG